MRSRVLRRARAEDGERAGSLARRAAGEQNAREDEQRGEDEATVVDEVEAIDEMVACCWAPGANRAGSHGPSATWAASSPLFFLLPSSSFPCSPHQHVPRLFLSPSSYPPSALIPVSLSEYRFFLPNLPPINPGRLPLPGLEDATPPRVTSPAGHATARKDPCVLLRPCERPLSAFPCRRLRRCCARCSQALLAFQPASPQSSLLPS